MTPSIQLGPCAPLAPLPPHAFPPPQPTPRPASHALLSTRQSTSAFNQPLSLDTFSVTDMRSCMRYMYMCMTCFTCARLACHAPLAFGLAFPEHAPLAPPPLQALSASPASRPTASPRVACPPFDSAARVSVQPAAELRHVQRHGYGPHVLRALRACSAPQHSVGPSPCTRRLRCRSPTPWRLPAHTSRPASHALLSTRQEANSLSDTNKLAIRCAWAGNLAFAFAGYDSSWVSGSCS